MPTPNRTTRPLPLLTGAALALLLQGAHAAEPQSTAAATTAIAESTSAVLQGDGVRAADALAASPADGFVGKHADYRACMLQRHRAAQPVHITAGIDDPFVRGVLDDYQDYWWRAMHAPASQRDAQEARLLQNLRKRLDVAESAAKDMDAIEPLVQARRRHRRVS